MESFDSSLLQKLGKCNFMDFIDIKYIKDKDVMKLKLLLLELVYLPD